MIKIELVFSGKILNTYVLDKPMIGIGRNPGNDIHIDNLAVSDKHARIVKDKDQYWIEDLGSTNGTFFENQKIKRAKLRDNQQIGIGKHTLTINIVSDVDASPDVMKTIKFNAKDH